MKISIILPAFNEQNNIKAIYQQLTNVLAGFTYEVIFVDDGSQDNTLAIIKEISQVDSRIRFISFSRNFGHQAALKAGLDAVQGDVLIFMDCDLQHPPALISNMIKLWQEGYEIVYTIRKDHQSTPFFKRLMANIFYKLINLLADFSIAKGRADFFLIDKKVAKVLRSYDESPLFFRGMLSWIGFKQVGIPYESQMRLSGVTKYSLKRMIEFAVDGITSFSIKPLRISIFCGIWISLGAFIYLVYTIYMRMFTDHVASGWASILACVLLLGGIQLITLGILGEYLGKLFMSAKRRPNYIVREQWDSET